MAEQPVEQVSVQAGARIEKSVATSEHATMSVDNAVDSWGYLAGIVDEHALSRRRVCKPGDNWGRRYTTGSAPDLRIHSLVHNPQALRRKRDLSARMTGDL